MSGVRNSRNTQSDTNSPGLSSATLSEIKMDSELSSQKSSEGEEEKEMNEKEMNEKEMNEQEMNVKEMNENERNEQEVNEKEKKTEENYSKGQKEESGQRDEVMTVPRQQNDRKKVSGRIPPVTRRSYKAKKAVKTLQYAKQQTSPENEQGEPYFDSQRYTDIGNAYNGDFREDYDDDYDENNDYTGTYEEYRNTGKTKTFRIYINGDNTFPGRPCALKEPKVGQGLEKRRQHWRTFVNEVVEMFPNYRVNFIFNENKVQCEDYDDILDKGILLVSEKKKLNTSIDYRSIKPKRMSHRKPSAGKERSLRVYNAAGSDTKATTSRASSNNSSSSHRKSRFLTFFSNHDVNRTHGETMLLNPNSSQPFEEMVKDLSGLMPDLRLDVDRIYCCHPPYEMVTSLSHLREIYDTKKVNKFICCPKGETPLELSKYDPHKHSNHGAMHKDGCQTERYTSTTGSSGYHSQGMNGMESPPRNPPGVHSVSNPKMFKPRQHKEPALLLPPHGSSAENNSQGILARQPFRLTLLPMNDSVKVDIYGHRREFHPPRFMPAADISPPDKKLQLDWVYGYRGRDASNNLHVLPKGQLVYYVSSVAIVYDKKSHKQLIYFEHSEDICSIAVHPVDEIVATGQLAGKHGNYSHVRVWDARSMHTYAILGVGFFVGGVYSLSFSGMTNIAMFEIEGELLMCVDDSPINVISVWAWKGIKNHSSVVTPAGQDPSKPYMLLKSPAWEVATVRDKPGALQENVVWGCFHRDTCTEVITYGMKHLSFWRLVWDNHNMRFKLLRDEKSGLGVNLPKYVTAVAFGRSGDVLVAGSDGSVSVWHKDRNSAYCLRKDIPEAFRHAHCKAIFTLCMLPDGTLLTGAGNEIRAWDSNMGFKNVKVRVIQDRGRAKGRNKVVIVSANDNENGKDILSERTTFTIPDAAGHVRCIVPCSRGATYDGAIYVATTNNFILEGTLAGKFSYVVQGHSDECWALAVHPTEPVFVTAGKDQQVIKWSSATHKVLWRISVNTPCVSVTFDSRGRHIIVGTQGGSFILINSLKGHQMASRQLVAPPTKVKAIGDGPAVLMDSVDCVKYSPDGNYLALGCHNGYVYIFKILEEDDDNQTLVKHRTGFLSGHRSCVLHLDWCKDSRHLSTLSGDYATLYWDVDMMIRIDPAQMTAIRDMDWEQPTVPLNYSLLGAWSNLQEGDDNNTYNRANILDDLVAFGDNRGNIKLYRYPIHKDGAVCYNMKAYSGHVTCCRFLSDDSYLLTMGGVECGLYQWAVTDL